MPSKTEDNRKKSYLQTDLSAKENQRLTEELEANPALLRELFQLETFEDKASSERLLFDNSNPSDQEALDGKIRRYLLMDSGLAEEEIVELENLLLEDERYFERMSLIESELVEDYLRGALTKNEEKKFDSFFLVTPERREKLENIKLLMFGAARSQPLIVPEREPKSLSSWWRSLIAFTDSSNLFAGAAAASVLLLLAVGVLFWTSQEKELQEQLIVTAPTNEPAQSPNQPIASNQSGNTEQSTTATPAIIPPQTNVLPRATKSPQSNQEPKNNETREPAQPVKPPVNAPRSVVFALFPGVSRSEGSGVEKKVGTGEKFVELQLRLDVEREYENFRVTVQDSDGNEVGSREKLKATKKGGLPTVTALLPAATFKPDDYTVILSGETKGAFEEAARYSFRVLK